MHMLISSANIELMFVVNSEFTTTLKFIRVALVQSVPKLHLNEQIYAIKCLLMGTLPTVNRIFSFHT